MIANTGRLSIAAGSVIKLGAAGTSRSRDQIYVAPGGSLDVAGRAGQPVIFTSYRDSSVGGRTAPAGSGAPSADYGTAIALDGRSSASVSYAIFRYGSASIVEANHGALSGAAGFCTRDGDVGVRVSHSVLEAPVDIGGCDTATGSRYTITANTFEMPSGSAPVALELNEPTCYTIGCTSYADNALSVTSSRFVYHYAGQGPVVAVVVSWGAVEGLALAGRGENSFSDTGHRVAMSVSLQGLVPAKTIFRGGPGAELTGQVLVYGTAVLQAGTVVPGGHFGLAPVGSLGVDGTAARPVRFTGGAWISTSGRSSLTVTHARFTGGTGPVISEVTGTNCGSSFGGATVSVKASTLYGGVALGGCTTGTAGGDRVSIVGDNFHVPAGTTALSLGMGCAGGCFPPDDQLVVSSNRFEPAPGKGSYPEVSITGWPVQGVALSGPDENRLSGRGAAAEVALSIADVPAGASWQVSPSSGAVLALSSGTLNQAGLYVQGQLKLDAGATVEVSSEGIDLGDSGTLDASGTAARPITVVTNKGSSSNGWALSPEEGSTVDVSHAVFSGGLVCLSNAVLGGPQATSWGQLQPD